jgi:SPX domain protein involved in polyphosphate accumulation
MQASSPLFFERYELKYLIPMELVEPISRMVEHYCVLDPYSERSHDKYYEVNNLYLDSPNFEFLQRRLGGMDNRFNMRIRSYGVHPTFPYFLEVKFKSRGFVKKKRAKVYGENWADELRGAPSAPEDGLGIKNTKDYKYVFIHLMQSYQVEPKVFTQYRRKAYLSEHDDYARVTFDKDLRFMRQSEFCLEPTESLMSHYDHPLNYPEGANVILELKCPTQVPLWFVDLIKTFNLERTSFSKYGTGVAEVIPDLFAHKFDRLSAHLF